MSQETLFVLNPAGGLSRWDLTKTELNLTDAITANFCSGVVRQLHGIFPMALIDPSQSIGYNANLTVLNNSYCVVSLPVRNIPLAAPFQVEGNIMFPEFDKPHPVVKLPWSVPDTMRLMLAVTIDSSFTAATQHLVAFDGANRSWRLPLSNLYEDCRLCSGRFDSRGISVLDACRRAWNQFQLSQWNSDLYKDATVQRRTASRKLFTYEVSGTTIEQKPFTGDWTTLCEKVATDHITKTIIPV